MEASAPGRLGVNREQIGRRDTLDWLVRFWQNTPIRIALFRAASFVDDEKDEAARSRVLSRIRRTLERFDGIKGYPWTVVGAVMSTWAKNDSELLGFLTGFDGRDAFSKRQHFLVVRDLNADDTADQEKPPLEVQNAVLALVYEVMEVIKKWLQNRSNAAPPTARELLDVPGVDHLFSKIIGPMVELNGVEAADSPKFVVLGKAVEGLVTEAWVERLRNEFASELARSLKVFQTRLEKNRTEYDDWRDELDGGIVLYDVFRPTIWETYLDFWNKWRADMARIHALTTRLQRLDEDIDARGGFMKKPVLFALAQRGCAPLGRRGCFSHHHARAWDVGCGDGYCYSRRGVFGVGWT